MSHARYDGFYRARNAIHMCGLCRHAVSVCPSVRLSVMFVNSVETNKHIFKFFSPSDSHIILVFFRTKCPMTLNEP